MNEKKYHIGIIGSGNIGGTLGTHFAKAGHQVMFSSRHPEQLQHLVAATRNKAQIGTIEEAAKYGEIILLSIPFGKTPELSEKIESLDGKVLIDTNNYYPGRDGQLPGEEMAEKGLLESQWTASYFPGAHVVKAFNTIYYLTLKNRALALEEVLAVPFAATDDKARIIAQGLMRDIGFQGVSIGDLSKTKIMQPDERLYTKEISEEELKELL